MEVRGNKKLIRRYVVCDISSNSINDNDKNEMFEVIEDCITETIEDAGYKIIPETLKRSEAIEGPDLLLSINAEYIGEKQL